MCACGVCGVCGVCVVCGVCACVRANRGTGRKCAVDVENEKRQEKK